MSNLPDPLTPAEVDIRGFSGFMLDVDRLLASELVALATPEEGWAAFMLWCRAWQQHPAGSLPNDERILAAFSRAGRRWAKVRGMALRGFVLCSDDRLYHPVVIEQVMSAWAKRKAYRADQERLRKWREQRRTGSEGNARGNVGGNGRETDFNRASETVPEMAQETVREPDRQGQGQGRLKKEPPLSPPAQPRRASARQTDEQFAAFWAAYPRKDAKADALKAWNAAVRTADPAEIVAGLMRYPFNPDPKFQKLPGGWLRDERWRGLELTPPPRSEAVQPSGSAPPAQVGPPSLPPELPWRWTDFNGKVHHTKPPAWDLT